MEPLGILEFRSLVQEIPNAELREKFLAWSEKNITVLSREEIVSSKSLKMIGANVKERTEEKLRAHITGLIAPFIIPSIRDDASRAGLNYTAMRAELWVLRGRNEQ